MYHKMFYANLLSVTYCIYMSDSLFESYSKINNQMTICPILDMKRKKINLVKYYSYKFKVCITFLITYVRHGGIWWLKDSCFSQLGVFMDNSPYHELEVKQTDFQRYFTSERRVKSSRTNQFFKSLRLKWSSKRG